MQRLMQWKGKWVQAKRQLSTALLLRQFAGAAIGALCAMLPLDYAAVTLCAPMCAALILRGMYAPLCFAAAATARVLSGVLAGDALIWCDAAAIALVCAGAWGICRVRELEKPWIAALCAAGAIMLSRVFALRLLALDWIILAVQMGCAFALYPVFCIAIAVADARSCRKILSQEETLCVSLTLAALLAGAAPIRILGFSPSVALSYFVVLVVCRGAGVGLGAGCAAVMGVALAAGLGGNWMMIANMTVCAVVCAVFQNIGRWAGALSFLFVNAVMTLVVNASSQIILNLRETLPATLAFCILPKEWIERCCTLISEQARRERDDSMILRRVSNAVHARLFGVAGVFSQMASCFSSVAGPQEISPQMHTSQMMQHIYGEVCARCALLNVCWKREYDATYEAMYDALENARETGHFDPRQIQPEFARRCLKTQQMIDCVNKMASLYILQNKWERRMDESRMLVAQQLFGVSELMCRMADELKLDVSFDGGVEREVRVQCDRHNMPQASEVTVLKTGGGFEVRMRCDQAGDRVNCVREGAQAVSQALGCRMRMAGELCDVSGQGKCACNYVQSVTYEVACGFAQRAAYEQNTCGDSSAAMQLDLSHHLLALSDGMGNGERAHAESSATVGLICNFFKAGFGRDETLRAINRLLLLRSGDEMFSTVDMCVFDCAKGACEVTKIAAAPGILYKNGRMHLLQSEALPMGVADTDVPDAMHFDLREGDGVFVMSDGVTDALGEQALVPLCEAYWRDCDGDVQLFCQTLVQAACACNGDMPRDDMTVTAGILRRT